MRRPKAGWAIGGALLVAAIAGLALLACLLLRDGGSAHKPAQTQVAGATPDPPTGRYTSLKLDAAGNPVVSYYDYHANSFKLLHCGNENCTGGNTTTTLDRVTDGSHAGYTSLALDRLGNPVVAYSTGSREYRAGILKVVHCTRPDCTGNTKIELPGGEGSGISVALALDNAGDPILSYERSSDLSLMFLRCGNTDCTEGNAKTTIASQLGPVGMDVTLLIGADDTPLIVYADPRFFLHVVRCSDPMCLSSIRADRLDGGGVGYPSVQVDAAGNPVVSYHDYWHNQVKVLHCGSATCSTGNIIATPTAPDAGSGGEHTSLALDSDGHPVVSYGGRRILHCGDATCSSGNSISTPDSSGGLFTSRALDAQGNPVVAYWVLTSDESYGFLKVLHCGNPDCTAGNSIVTP